MFWLFNHSWPETNICRARLKQAGSDHFSPEFQGHKIWLIEWTQVVRAGESVWDGSTIVPSIISIAALDADRNELEV